MLKVRRSQVEDKPYAGSLTTRAQKAGGCQIVAESQFGVSWKTFLDYEK